MVLNEDDDLELPNYDVRLKSFVDVQLFMA